MPPAPGARLFLVLRSSGPSKGCSKSGACGRAPPPSAGVCADRDGVMEMMLPAIPAAVFPRGDVSENLGYGERRGIDEAESIFIQRLCITVTHQDIKK
jgi:hypothetical protein